MRPALYYSVLRLGLFAVAFLLLFVAGARSWLLLALAALVSAVVSYFVLSRQRNAMAGAIDRRITGFRQRLDAGTRAEDDD
jgi:uncharacterized membrane protein YjjB (DUF3815 family)